jgi:hypothetical protein
MQFGLENPNHYRMMFMTSHPPLADEEMEKNMGKGNPEEDSYAFLQQTVRAAVNAGAFRPELTDVDLIAQTLWAGVHGVVSLQIAKCDDDWVPWRSFKDRAELIIDGLIHGLLKRG